jgi:hypothetical protein
MRRPMSRKRMQTPVRLLAALAAISAPALFAARAFAATTTSTLTGTVQSNIAIAVGTAPLPFTTGFYPGGTATTSGTLVVSDTNATPTLTVQDATSTSNYGHMHAAATGCSGSEAALANPLQVTVSGTPFTSAGTVSLAQSATTVATASAPVAAATLTTSYEQKINSSETLLAGCVYSVTATYTLS